MCPGGVANKIYSYILAGDVSLSIPMTLISTVAALGKYIHFISCVDPGFLLDRDVSLSITTTLISTEAALGKYNRGGSRISGKGCVQGVELATSIPTYWAEMSAYRLP